MMVKTMNLVVLVVWIFTLLMSIQVESCKPNWIRHAESCYRIYSEGQANNDAQISCHNENARLASISDQETLHFLSSQLEFVEGEQFWVGLQETEDNLIWNNNVSADDQGWVVPVYSPMFELVHCYALGQSIVTPQVCRFPFGYICETNYKIQLSKRCLRGYVSDASLRCIFRNEFAMTKVNAESQCDESGGEFMDINEIVLEGVKALYLHDVLSEEFQESRRFWTKLQWNGTKILLPSGTEWNGAEAEGTSWFPGIGECVTVAFNKSDEMQVKLYQTDCSATAYMVCGTSRLTTIPAPITTTPIPRRDESLSCPQGFNWKEDKASGFCFWETSYETSRLSWDDARRYCQSYGGDLASFHNIQEEKIGLNFQYGSLSHPYWIGLKLNLNSGKYVWTDNTSLDYENWAPGEPNHRDMRLRCAAMDASAKHWVSSLCGILSWFVCKAPKQLNPKVPVLPTRTPLIPCSSESVSMYYFEGFCYQYVNDLFSWHRAEQYCQNIGARLVSIHDDKEIGFLLRLLDEDRSRKGNRIWIGLNSLGFDGAFRWSDHSLLDFTYWNENEPNNNQNQEKCCNMYARNGLWNDENCNALMGFVCKVSNDTSSTQLIPSTPATNVGNCKKGWYPFQDRCYLPVGEMEAQRANWSIASSICDSYGGYLASVRDRKEQAFLSLLMQRLKTDTWIGLHDTVESGLYYWTDNSDMRYTNWAPGEPSFYGYEEDCILMVYDSIYRGSWKDEQCSRKLPFICQNQKDPKLELTYNRGMNCLHPEGWLQLDNSCYSMFPRNAMSWAAAQATCQKHGAHLISVSEPVVHNVAQYLADEANTSFWIGLQANSDNKLSWLNDIPVTMTRWYTNEPADLTNRNFCFVSSIDGFWMRTSCSDQLPFICQVTSGRRPALTRRSGNCPSKADLWISGEGSYCYTFDSTKRLEWHLANFRCHMYGGSLTSIHSLEEMDRIKTQFNIDKSFYIGLVRNEIGGFAWSDDSPVDFVNWDDGEPQSYNESNTDDRCVVVTVDTLKWKVSPCNLKRPFLCSGLKDTIIYEDSPETAYHTDDSGKSLPVAALAVTIVILTVIIVAAAVSVFIYNRPLLRFRFRLMQRQQSMSFENALYNADSASMEFETEKNQDRTMT